MGRSRKRTASGDLVSVRRSASGHLYARKAEISKCDMVATNGVAHQVDALLLPRPSGRGQARRSRTSSTSIPSNCSEEKKNTCFVKARHHALCTLCKHIYDLIYN